jgi:dihydrolipoamide dehydrogenase
LLISALGKSHCDNCSDGFIKILSQNGKIVGAHIVSKEASSLIQQITIAMQNNIAIDDLKKVCFAHPTYSEGIFECLFK